MNTELVLDAWGSIDSEIPANSDCHTEQFALLMQFWTVKPYSLPYSMSHNRHVITHGCPINLHL